MTSATSGLARFFVALLPPPALQDEITAIKHDIWQRFGSKAALNAPPHITLQPPFHWPVAAVNDLEQVLAAFAQPQPSVPVKLRGYSAFAPRVLYIDVDQTPELMALQPALMAHLEQHCGLHDRMSQSRPFTPHLTVGFRDLTPAAFHQAWAEFEQRPFAAEFVVSTLTLLRHSEHTGEHPREPSSRQRWQVFSEFLLHG